MGSELSFLIDLLLNHDLPKATKDLLASRIKEVEQMLIITRFTLPATPQIQNMPPQLQQSPSTLALMAKHGDIPNSAVPITNAEPPIPHVFTDGEMNARQKSMDILKGRKQQHLKV